MALIALELPAGIYNHGTDLDSSGRWIDGNFIRWQNGSVRPIGGWTTRKASATASVPRGAVAWTDHDDDARIAVGTHNKLYAINQGSTVSDITPTSFTAGAVDGNINYGFGGQTYGNAAYGTSRDGALPANVTTWSLDNFGEYLVACSSADGKIYQWQLNSSTVAAVLSNAPTGNKAMMVTDERFVFALAAGGNLQKVQWSDRENNNLWAAATTNQAGDIELQTSGEIMCGIRVKGSALILTTLDAHSATYAGPPFVYSFSRVGTSCGIISRQAAIAVDEGAFWMGTGGFFKYNGSSVQEMPCEVLDYVFTSLNAAQRSKVCAIHNSQFGEVWWFYPSGNSMENDRYVVYDYKEGHWNIGTLSRTSGVDLGAFRSPLWFDASGNLYNHEFGLAHDSAPFLESGPIAMGSGQTIIKVNEIIPDEGTQGDVSLTFKTRFYPNGEESSHGPFTLGNPTGARFQGRQVRMRINGTDLKDWRAGKMRLNVIEGGRR
jgi:hypothetical protein